MRVFGNCTGSGEGFGKYVGSGVSFGKYMRSREGFGIYLGSGGEIWEISKERRRDFGNI